MLSYKFVAASAGAIIVVTVAVVLTYPFAQTNDVNFSKAAKLDVSRGQPDVQCPKIAWPYGCEWHPAYLNGPTG
jgi:hypothetical protein